MFKNRGQHVVPRDGKWSVLKPGASRTSGSYATQKEAVERARELAKSQGAILYIHGANGLIRDRRSYQNDPHPSKGKRMASKGPVFQDEASRKGSKIPG